MGDRARVQTETEKIYRPVKSLRSRKGTSAVVRFSVPS